MMSTPLSVALNIERLICEARARKAGIDVSAIAAELYLRFFASGCSRQEIAEALQDEAAAAGLTTH
jgi:hypothetical protein